MHACVCVCVVSGVCVCVCVCVCGWDGWKGTLPGVVLHCLSAAGVAASAVACVLLCCSWQCSDLCDKESQLRRAGYSSEDQGFLM